MQQGSDLYEVLLRCQHFSELDAAKTMRQLGLGLIHMHSHRIAHRDIKPENIFVRSLAYYNYIGAWGGGGGGGG